MTDSPRASSGPLGRLSVPRGTSDLYPQGFLCGRAGRLAAESGGCRPGQIDGAFERAMAPWPLRCDLAVGRRATEIVSTSIGTCSSTAATLYIDLSTIVPIVVGA